MVLVSIESTGAMSAETLMKESINILIMKSNVLLNEINAKKIYLKLLYFLFILKGLICY